MDEIPAITEKAPFVHGDIPGDLLHPGFIRVRCHSCNFNLAAFKMVDTQFTPPVGGDYGGWLHDFQGSRDRTNAEPGWVGFRAVVR